jgi:hypothetical protein
MGSRALIPAVDLIGFYEYYIEHRI